MSNPTRCAYCASILHTGEARVLIGLTLDELEKLAVAVDGPLRRRLMCAIGLLDTAREAQLLQEIIW